MGRKLKRKQRKHSRKPEAKEVIHQLFDSGIDNDDFGSWCSNLATIFSQFKAEDVLISLCISDLWLPNISSQVKHSFAFLVAASMEINRFNETNGIDNYHQYQTFIQQVYTLLPTLRMLEDYVPEADWGDIKINSMGSLLWIFYGGSIERIPDFIKAFQIVYGSKTSALRDMHAALMLQHHIITKVDRDDVGSAYDIDRGHIEIPSETFWAQCRHAVLSASIIPEIKYVSPGLVLKLGELSLPKKWGDFTNGVMNGSAIPVFSIEVNGRKLPISIRNSAGAVIEFWAKKLMDLTSISEEATVAIMAFLEQRFVPHCFVPGPFQLVTRTQGLPYTFTATLTGRTIYLIYTLPETALAQLPSIETKIHNILNRDKWVLVQRDGSAIQIRKADGTLPTGKEIVIIAVLARVSTVNGMLRIPRTKNTRVLPLSDFITIFDTIEEIQQLDRFWTFIDEHSHIIGGFCGVSDRFAAFCDSHSLIIEGAVVPTFVSLDPHWGSNWRFRHLKDFWMNAPPLFPDDRNTAWKVERDSDDLYELTAKGAPVLSWCTVIEGCVLHFMFVFADQPLEAKDGHILELFVHCLADSLAQSRTFISGLSLFNHHRIVTVCRANPELLPATELDDGKTEEQPLFSDWSLTSEKRELSFQVTLQVNLRRVLRRITDPVNASFEAEVAIAWIEGLTKILDVPTDPMVFEAITLSGNRLPRFTLKVVRRMVDIPEFANPTTPGPEHYKIARRDLAVIFKEIGAEEGKYELAAAKTLIDQARDRFRSLVHNRITELNRYDLITNCVEQIDALIGKYDHETMRIKISLAHEVSYNRAERLAEIHKTFIEDSRNVRYLLECCLSFSKSASGEMTKQKIVEIVASIDWLMVLYEASDVLHNGIEVAGIELDNFFIPHVYYSDDRDDREKAFSSETADLKLGVGVIQEDEVSAVYEDSEEWRLVDEAFLHDVGIRVSDFIASLLVLSRWPSVNGGTDLRWSYTATPKEIHNVLVKAISDLTESDAEKIISLATIQPDGVRRLLGKSFDESDIPIWEHKKRGNRYTIKPLIMKEDGSILWGAAAVERAARIWRSSIANGYLSANFDWPQVAKAVRAIKAYIENQLEIKAFDIVKKIAPHSLRGIDFKRRFAKERFEDVGDYDVLAYWPDKNQWLIIECKYNQPAFCLKDARRLRDRIFGTERNRAQFSKIERRRAFLLSNIDRLRTLLTWPEPDAGADALIAEAYVSRDIYWWMRNPPYEVSMHFIRIDALDNWLKSKILNHDF